VIDMKRRKEFLANRLVAVLLCLSAVATFPAGCSLLFDTPAEQCKSDADCSAFGATAQCDIAVGTCILKTATSSGSGSTGGGGAGEGGGGSGPVPKCADPTSPPAEINGDITADDTLTCDKTYLLKGQINIVKGVTLTIEAGTTLLGDPNAVLVVQPGGKLNAVGKKDLPIVFTSAKPEGMRAPGDWGGLILLGQAPTNHHDAMGNPIQGKIEGVLTGGLYGGLDEDDSSGVLKFLRIEYGGVKIAPNNEINGLTFGGVGRGTIVDFVQVRHTLDDCFEFFGGTVEAKHLACQYPQDDGFDWDNGYKGKLQFLVLQQDPNWVDDMNGFEGDNYPTADPVGNPYGYTPKSEPTIYNATLCGKNNFTGAKEQYGVLARRGTLGHLRNVVFAGFQAGFDKRDNVTDIEITNSVFDSVVCDYACTETDDDGGFDEAGYLATMSNQNAAEGTPVVDGFNANAPNFTPNPFPNPPATPPSDGFFDTTGTYIGAFRDATDTWATSGSWAVWTDK